MRAPGRTRPVLTGLAIGAAALAVVPFAVPLLWPIAKAAIKGGIYAYDSAVELYNQAVSRVTELAAEAQREVNATTGAASAPHRGGAATEHGMGKRRSWVSGAWPSGHDMRIVWPSTAFRLSMPGKRQSATDNLAGCQRAHPRHRARLQVGAAVE